MERNMKKPMGRPHINSKLRNDNRLSVLVPKSLAAWMELTAKQRGIAKAQVVREALERMKNKP